MSAAAPLVLQDLRTRGWTLLEAAGAWADLEAVAPAVAARRSFEGALAEAAAGLLGPCMLSFARIGAPAGWHRGRADTVQSGAPPEFIPGLDLVRAREPMRAALIPGSGRLRSGDPAPEALAVELSLRPDQALLLDTRLWRRWPAPAPALFFSVVRAWLEPEADFRALAGAEASPADRLFFGAATQPATDVGRWLSGRERRPK